MSTFAFKVLIALKGRNALILSCHRGAQHVAESTGLLVEDVLEQHGAPVDLVQWIQHRASRQTTLAFMHHPGVSLILATGGPSMVRAAYSSGKPAIGVGPGNAPVLVCADADITASARMVVDSKSFEHGIICASENHLVVDAALRQIFPPALEACGAYILSGSEVQTFIDEAFAADGKLQEGIIGASGASIARMLGIGSGREDIRLLVVPVESADLASGLSRELLAPIVTLSSAGSTDEGMRICRQFLDADGMGHTAVIHTRSRGQAERFGLQIPASRILVNAPAVQGSFGMCTALEPSFTLGCGTFGGTSATDSITYRHLLNIKRVAWSGPRLGFSPG